MPEQIQEETAALLATMLRKTLFVATSRAIASTEANRPFIIGHFRYMNALGACGARSPPGPSRSRCDRLNILDATDEAEAA